MGGTLFSSARALFYESFHSPYKVGVPGRMCHGNKHPNMSVVQTVFTSLGAKQGVQVPQRTLNHVVLTQGPRLKEAPIDVVVHRHHGSRKNMTADTLANLCCYLEMACVILLRFHRPKQVTRPH